MRTVVLIALLLSVWLTGCSTPEKPYSSPEITAKMAAKAMLRKDWEAEYECWTARAKDQNVGYMLMAIAYDGAEPKLKQLGLTKQQLLNIDDSSQFERQRAAAQLLPDKKSFFVQCRERDDQRSKSPLRVNFASIHDVTVENESAKGFAFKGKDSRELIHFALEGDGWKLDLPPDM